ncbi:unnamed protein product [Closterium sp. NIES-54]
MGLQMARGAHRAAGQQGARGAQDCRAAGRAGRTGLQGSRVRGAHRAAGRTGRAGGHAGASPSLSPQWLVRRARLRSGATGAGRAGAAGAAGAGGTGGPATTGLGGARTRGTGDAGTGGVGGARVGDPTEPRAARARGSGPGTVRPQPYFVPLLQQVLGVLSSTSLTPPLLCPPPDQSQLPLQSASPPPTPSPYTEQSGGLIELCEPSFLPASPVRTARHVPCSRPPPISGTHAMALRPSSVPLIFPLPPPPESSLPETPPESSLPEVPDLRDYATALVAESESDCPPSVGGECALGTDVLEDRQEDFECLAAAVPRFASMLLATEGDPDAPDIPTPCSYAEAITGTYIDEVPPPGANIVDGMWIFRVKRPPGSPLAFKVRYIARGFSQRQGVDYFQTFSPTPKMTTLWVLLHIATQRDYELHSLDFSTAFLQGSLHEEI